MPCWPWRQGWDAPWLGRPEAVLALLDAPTGLAGNMLLAALLDLGLPQGEIDGPLAALGLAGTYRLELEERRSGCFSLIR